MPHAEPRSNRDSVKEVFNLIHNMSEYQFFRLASVFCESMADYVNSGEYKKAFTRMVESLNQHHELHKEVETGKGDVVNAVQCWTTHPHPPLNVHTFLVYSATQVASEMVMVVLTQPFITEEDFEVLTKYWTTVMGTVSSREKKAEIPNVFRSAFDPGIISGETKSGNNERSSEVSENTNRAEPNEGESNKRKEEFFYDPSDS